MHCFSRTANVVSLMKTIYPILLFCVLFSVPSEAQFNFGVKAGVFNTEITPGSIVSHAYDHDMELTVLENEYGIQFGIWAKLSFLGIYLEPGITFNSTSTTYMLQEFFSEEMHENVLKENYKYVDIPINVGVKLGLVRCYAGPVIHLVIDSPSELFKIEGYEQKFDMATYGVALGVGLDVWRFRLDLGFEANLSKFGDHITLFNQEYAFDDAPSRTILSLGYQF